MQLMTYLRVTVEMPFAWSLMLKRYGGLGFVTVKVGDVNGGDFLQSF